MTDFAALGTYVRLVTTDATRIDEARDLLRNRSPRSGRGLQSLPPRLGVDVPRRRGRRPLRAGQPAAGRSGSVALRAAALSDGDVDPTLGNALAAVGYDRDFASVAAFGPAVRIVTRPAPGWRRIRLDQMSGRAAHRARRHPSGPRRDGEGVRSGQGRSRHRTPGSAAASS